MSGWGIKGSKKEATYLIGEIREKKRRRGIINCLQGRRKWSLRDARKQP